MTRGRVDSNHREVVKALRGVGATVQSLSDIGAGCPDLLVGYRGRNWVFEVKDGTLSPSQRRLTADEKKWHDLWRGQVTVVERAADAVDIVLSSH